MDRLEIRTAGMATSTNITLEEVEGQAIYLEISQQEGVGCLSISLVYQRGMLQGVLVELMLVQVQAYLLCREEVVLVVTGMLSTTMGEDT